MEYMKKIAALKVIAILIALVLFAGGFLLGLNFVPLKDYIFNTGGVKAAVNETENTKDIFANPEGNLSAKSIIDTINLVAADALTKKTNDELIKSAIEGILNSLDDKHADYFSIEDYNNIMNSYAGTMSGIGVVVTLNDKGQVVIVNAIEDTPAFIMGVKEGDIITKVEGKDISGMALDNVVAMMRGKEGTEVNLTIYRPSENKTMDLKIKRAKFYVPNFITKLVEKNICYIQYMDFQENGAQKLDGEIQKFIDNGAKGIILDLRDNLGGILNDAVELCDLFLDKGVIVTVRGRSNNKDSFQEFDARSGKYTVIPIIVLINGYSASASELAAGALKDNKRATIVGEKSYGKGTVQILERLSDGSGIKFTTAKYYLPSGITIDGTGIEPDIVVPLKPEDKEDLQLNKAIEEIKKLIK
jgi:carboxyl-terminal processing protease